MKLSTMLMSSLMFSSFVLFSNSQAEFVGQLPSAQYRLRASRTLLTSATTGMDVSTSGFATYSTTGLASSGLYSTSAASTGAASYQSTGSSDYQSTAYVASVPVSTGVSMASNSTGVITSLSEFPLTGSTIIGSEGQVANNSCPSGAPVIVDCATQTMPGFFPSSPQPSLPNGNCSTCCPYPKGGTVGLQGFTLSFDPDTTNEIRDAMLYPPFSSSNNFYYYTLNQGESTGLLTFTLIYLTPGSSFRIRANFAPQFDLVNPGQSVTFQILPQTNLIEFDVIQAPCAGDDIQEYSITIYQPTPMNNPSSSTGEIAPVTISSTGSNGGNSEFISSSSTGSSEFSLSSSTGTSETGNCSGANPELVVVPCSNVTLTSTNMPMTSPPQALPNGACSCLCPYAKGALIEAYSYQLSFASTDASHADDDQINSSLTPISWILVPHPNFQSTSFVYYRGQNTPYGWVSLVVTSASVGAILLVRINFLPTEYFLLPVNETVLLPIIPGTNFIQLDVKQAPCAGDDIEEYSFTIYQSDAPAMPVNLTTVPSSIILPNNTLAGNNQTTAVQGNGVQYSITDAPTPTNPFITYYTKPIYVNLTNQETAALGPSIAA